MRAVPDQAERDAALDPARSFIVQAPAGSGKTELLVRRFLVLLGRVERPEEILAITFTKKAAAEMRRRVLERLAEAGQPVDELAHRLRIDTIDALCVALTRQMPVLARFGAPPEIVEDASELYREAAARTLAKLGPAVEKLLAHIDNDVGFATRLLADMLRSRDRWIRKTGSAPTRQELEAALASQVDRLLGKARALYPAATQALARELLTQKKTWVKRDPLAQSLSGNEPLRQALAALYDAPPVKYAEAQWAALESILALLFPAVAELRVLFGETGKADFTEFAHGALAALGSAEDPSDLLLRLDQRLSHILVDEFQDTSESQFRLLERLTAGWQPGDGRTIFLVGDPMQSIYRFREAEVSLFIRTRHEGLGTLRPEPLVLSANFRSQASLVEWFNRAFSAVLPAEEDEVMGGVPYARAAPHHPALAGPPVQWHCSYDRRQEAARVVEIVQGVHGTCAILVRNRAHLDEIVPALRDAGIRWRAIQIEQLGEKQVVQDLYALARALTHLGDRVAALAVLRAPWCGLTLSDLLLLVSGNTAPQQADLFGAGGNEGARAEPRKDDLVSDLMRDTSHLSPDGQKRIARVRTVLEASWRNRMRGTLRDRVEGAWLALGGPACVQSETELEDAEIFLDELERLETAGGVDFAALDTSLERLWAQPDAGAPQGAVEIMTIHRAKGLEFDTVIVPGLDRLPRSGPRPLFAWKSLMNKGLLLAPISPVEEPIYDYLRQLDRDSEDLEAGRLFYVAATRAESRLHLLACAKPAEEGGPKEPTRRSLLAKIWHEAREHFGPVPADLLAEPERAVLPDILRRLPAGFAFDFSQAASPLTWDAPAERKDADPIEFSWAGETARHVGTVAHRWLQRMAEDALAGWDAARVEALRPRFAEDLSRRGVPAAELERSAALVGAALANALEDPRGRWLLGPQAEARSEHRIRARTPEGVRTFILDRMFRADGRLWIVDYKTSRHEGADVEAFLDRERERYAPQLSGYATLFKEAEMGLYFPVLKGWRQWRR